MTVFDLEKKLAKIGELEKETEEENFWKDSAAAQKKLKELERLRESIRKISDFETETASIEELLQVTHGDEKLQKDMAKKIASLEKDLDGIEFELMFQDEYDSRDAIVSIHSGTGGTDAQDWAAILLRMYLRYAERKQWKAKIISETRGQEAGIKSVTLEISGETAYGHLRSEAGIHRLVRLSPYNSKNLRQTSFALVEVLPEIEKIESVRIDSAELRIDTFRAGGAGGQSVNKTSSAVRITHVPTGLAASSQSERSQLQNKEQALTVLTAKLHQRYLAQKEEQEKKLKGKHAEVQWGSQIRSYVLHPYKLVKDHRTKYESKNPEDVLDGNIDEFIGAYHKHKKACS